MKLDASRGHEASEYSGALWKGREVSQYAGSYPTEFSEGVAEADTTWARVKPEYRKDPGLAGSEDGLMMQADMKSRYRYNRQIGADENQHYAFIEGYVSRMQQLYREA